MDTKKISIEVTPEQLEKLKRLEDRGFTVGEVIDKFSELEERIISHGNSFIDESIQHNLLQESLPTVIFLCSESVYQLRDIFLRILQNGHPSI
ncbi:MAG: hypothetical protein MJ232_06670, partial [archaeon]|nr:hypothetical protein [archaeon]